MILLEDEPTLTDLHRLIGQVPSYPIAVKQLVDLALSNHAPKPVIEFYKSFPGDEIFSDKDDLMVTTDNVEMLRHQTAPAEEMFAPEDD